MVHAEFSGDELILALMSLIRATYPAMLRQGPEGFTVDFQMLDGKPTLTDDDRLLFKFRMAIENSSQEKPVAVELKEKECLRLAETLEHLESLQPWPQDVLEMSRNLRARVTRGPEPKAPFPGS